MQTNDEMLALSEVRGPTDSSEFRIYSAFSGERIGGF